MKNIRTFAKCSALLLLATLNPELSTWAQGNVFTYQGRVNDSGGPVNGPAELRFTLWDVESGGTMPLASNTPPVLALTVSNGLFTVPLNFGAGRFNGADRWVQVELRTTLGPFNVINPRQKVTPTPYAITAANLSGTLPATQLSGTLPSGLLNGTYGGALTFNNTANQFTGNGATLSNVNAVTLAGRPASGFWQTTGNGGTSPGVNFLGTTDNQPIELKVHGQPALRLIPATNAFGYGFSPNIIGGFSGNTIDAGVIGSVISGGGRGDGLAHRIGAHHGTIGGGDRNTVGGENGTIAGGGGNFVSSTYSFIGGGLFNTIQTNTGFGACATLSGGYGNFIDRNAWSATIGGGQNNTIHSNNTAGFIGGGGQNVIQLNAHYSTIGGGVQNTIRSNSGNAAIVGGQGHGIAAPSGFIGGGWQNQIQVGASYGLIVGGRQNTIRSNAFNAAIVAGQENTNSAAGAFIGGGWLNQIERESYNSVIAGGDNNAIGAFANQSTISGGVRNTNNGAFGAIGGGENNTASGQYATIAGGRSHLARGQFATVGGGSFNQCDGFAATLSGGHNNFSTANYTTVGGGNFNSASGAYATVPGGFNNFASGEYSLAAGRLAFAQNHAAFVWAGGATNFYRSKASNSFNVYATGGASFDYAGQAADGRGNRWVFIGPTPTGDTLVAWNNAKLTDGGIWSNASDKNRKTDLKAIDPREVLERVAALPISQWRYTNESANVKHIGPMAQDFHAAFGLGSDDKSIGTVDSEGVALAAIQGLNQKVEEQAKQLRAKDDELQTLKRRLDRLEALLTNVERN